jgi:hypothetical protein|nr:hypothetical protein [uncultured Mediterranean phage uvMED]BAR29784.1 hypothetical protein [uncultured Mediterranean phage uvMED]
MKKYLIVSGCSWGDPNFISAEHPDMDTSWKMWPEILAEKLDMQLINFCKSGQGQEYIYSTLIDKIQTMPISQIGLMIPAWSTAPRRDYQMSGFQTRKNLWTADMYDWRGCIEYWIDRSMRYYYSFQSIMQLHRIPYRQVQMVHMYTGYMWEQFRQRKATFIQNVPKNIKALEHAGTYGEDKLDGDDYIWKKNYKKMCRDQVLSNSYYNKIDKNFINWMDPGEAHDIKPNIDRISEKDLHPSEKGQQQIAEFIYDRLG